MEMDPVGAAMEWIAAYGILGLLVVSLLERFVPVMPSYGLLAAVGIAAAQGKWTLPEALVVSIAGSIGGCVLFYALARALGERQSRKLVYATAHIFGTTNSTVDVWLVRIDRNQASLAFTTQLVPTVRLLAPGLAGLARLDLRVFLIAAGAGTAVWNGLFIGIGYAGARIGNDINASLLALGVLALLLVVEGAVFLILDRIRSLRSRPDRATVEQSRPASAPNGLGVAHARCEATDPCFPMIGCRSHDLS